MYKIHQKNEKKNAFVTLFSFATTIDCKLRYSSQCHLEYYFSEVRLDMNDPRHTPWGTNDGEIFHNIPPSWFRNPEFLGSILISRWNSESTHPKTYLWCFKSELQTHFLGNSSLSTPPFWFDDFEVVVRSITMLRAVKTYDTNFLPTYSLILVISFGFFSII